MKSLSILGSTGSIGRSTLKVVARFPQQFKVRALTAKSNVDLLAQQIVQFKPDVAAVFDKTVASKLKEKLPGDSNTQILSGQDGYKEAASLSGVEIVVSAMVGAAGLKPTLAAIEAGKTIALANKETLVMAGTIVMALAVQKGVKILPVDSEHSAIFQCLQGNRQKDLEKIILTASGGPFLDRPAKDFASIDIETALNHPNWKMGPKISIDSATLMNKGLEVIEAMHLFGVGPESIQVVVHPQSIIHSMVAYHDGSVMAQLGIPDMAGAIAYALSFPKRMPLKQPLPDWAAIGALTFKNPDMEKFPCLAMAFEAGRTGGTLPAVLNGANEITVAAFLEHKIAFTEIAAMNFKTMQRHQPVEAPTLDDIIEADTWARQMAAQLISEQK